MERSQQGQRQGQEYEGRLNILLEEGRLKQYHAIILAWTMKHK